MNGITHIETRRREVLAQMESIRSVERATLKEQMLPVKHKDKDKPVLRGPYAVLVRSVNGKTKSRRVPSGELPQVRQDAENHKRLKALMEEFTVLTERLGQLEREQAASEEAVKKGVKSPSNKTRKSRGS